MKSQLLFFLSIFIVVTTSGQEVDKNAQFYFYSSFNKQPESVRKAIATDSARKGIFLITDIIIDTLNKNELIVSSPKKAIPGSSTIKMDGAEVGVLDPVTDPDRYKRSSYDYMEGAVAVVHADTFMLNANSTTASFSRSSFGGFTAMIGKTAIGKTRFFEQSADSTAIYRSTASPKNQSRIEVPAYLSNCYYDAWPANRFARIYGRAALITDAFYVKDENFTGKYLLKRYTIAFVYRSQVYLIKK